MIAGIAISVSSFGQLKVTQESKTIVGEVKAGSNFIADLTYRVYGKDTIAAIVYHNCEYSTLYDVQDISFNKSQTNDLYLTLKTFFTNENIKNKEYELKFELGKNHIVASNYRILGITGIRISVTGGGYFFLNAKQLEKLFGTGREVGFNGKL